MKPTLNGISRTALVTIMLSSAFALQGCEMVKSKLFNDNTESSSTANSGDNPENFNVMEIAGDQAASTGNYQQAAQYYAAAARVRGDDPNFRAKFADALRRSGRADQAAILLSEDVETGTADANAQITYAKALLRSNRSTEALQILENLVDNYPENAEAHVTHGLALDANNRHLEAIEAYYLALALGSENSSRVLNNLALAQARIGQIDAALENLNKAAQIDPESQTVRRNLELVAELQNQPTQMITAPIQSASNTAPNIETTPTQEAATEIETPTQIVTLSPPAEPEEPSIEVAELTETETTESNNISHSQEPEDIYSNNLDIDMMASTTSSHNDTPTETTEPIQVAEFVENTEPTEIIEIAEAAPIDSKDILWEAEAQTQTTLAEAPIQIAEIEPATETISTQTNMLDRITGRPITRQHIAYEAESITNTQIAIEEIDTTPIELTQVSETPQPETVEIATSENIIIEDPTQESIQIAEINYPQQPEIEPEAEPEPVAVAEPETDYPIASTATAPAATAEEIAEIRDIIANLEPIISPSTSNETFEEPTHPAIADNATNEAFMTPSQRDRFAARPEGYQPPSTQNLNPTAAEHTAVEYGAATTHIANQERNIVRSGYNEQTRGTTTTRNIQNLNLPATSDVVLGSDNVILPSNIGNNIATTNAPPQTANNHPMQVAAIPTTAQNLNPYANRSYQPRPHRTETANTRRGTTRIRYGMHNNFDRIVIDELSGQITQTQYSGNQISLTLPQNSDISLENLRQHMARSTENLSINQNGGMINLTITLKDGTELRSWRSAGDGYEKSIFDLYIR